MSDLVFKHWGIAPLWGATTWWWRQDHRWYAVGIFALRIIPAIIWSIRVRGLEGGLPFPTPPQEPTP